MCTNTLRNNEIYFSCLILTLSSRDSRRYISYIPYQTILKYNIIINFKRVALA